MYFNVASKRIEDNNKTFGTKIIHNYQLIIINLNDHPSTDRPTTDATKKNMDTVSKLIKK